MELQTNVKFDTKTEARIRILRNAAEVCRLISEESRLYWSNLQKDLNRAADIIEKEASDD